MDRPAGCRNKSDPLWRLSEGEVLPKIQLLLGNHAGSFGETCALLILICGLYLMIKKTASYQIILSGLMGFILFQSAFYWSGTAGAADPLSGLLSGSFLFGIMFMATDPISSSQTTDGGRWIYGFLVGSLTSLIRTFSVWPEGLTFALLLANMFAPSWITE